MEFRIFHSPQDLYSAIIEKNKEKAQSARLVAGFCWPWSNPNQDGTLVNDVVIDDKAPGGFNLTFFAFSCKIYG